MDEVAIKRQRAMIQEHGQAQDALYENLLGELGLIATTNIEDYLFDYVYNSGAPGSFVEYLTDMGREDLVTWKS